MHRALAMSSALLLLPLTLRAEEPPDVSAPPDVEQVVVTGTVLKIIEEQVFEDSAIQMELIGIEEIEALPVRDASGVIEYLAGVRTSQRIQGQKSAVSIEGMPVEYTEILVDGQRFSGEIGGAGDLADFSLENVERIEVLRGAQGTRYGSDAAGGVINLVTRNAPETGYRFGGQGEGGTDRYGLGGGTAAGRLGPLGLSLSGQFERIDGFDEPDDEDVVLAAAGGGDSSERENFLYGKWDAPIGDALTLRGNGLWRVEHDDLVFVDEGSSEDTRASLTDTNWRANGGLDWTPREDTRFAGDLTFYAVNTDSQVGRDFTLFEDEVAADLYGEHELDTGPIHHVLRAGSEIDWQRLDLDEGELPLDTGNEELTDRNIDETFLAPSVYLQTESDLTSWLTLLAGVRGEFHSRFDAKALPQVGVLLRPPVEGLELRASWGLNYRTPSLRDLHQPPTAQLGGAYLLAGNEDLEAESSMSIRAGFEWRASSWLTVAGTGFYNDIDDNIRSQFKEEIEIGRELRTFFPDDLSEPEVAICEAQRLFFPDPDDWTPECAAFFAGEPITRELLIKSPLFAKENIDSVRTWGAESQVRIRLADWLRVWVDYTWLNTEVVDSNIDIDELPNEPDHAVTARALLVSPWSDTRFTTGFRWRGPVIPEGSGTGLLSFASGDKTDPSYQLDFRVAQPFWDDRIRLHFDVVNVTNERREDSYAIRGRQFIAGISGEFGPADDAR
jgi:outer membrane receptor protein involved in Fe transport